MKNWNTMMLSLAVTTLAAAVPALAQAGVSPTANTSATVGQQLAMSAALSPVADGTMSGTPTTLGLRAQREAMEMVPAIAHLQHNLNARNAAQGYQVRAVLDHTVHLANGTELPGGTLLVGKVEEDDMNVQGRSKVALRFSQAVLKSGQTLPIKATIVGVYKQDYAMDDMDNPNPPNTWTPHTLQVDQIGVSKDVDLHSRIASRNSGVFVTTHDKDVKLPSGTELDLALGSRMGANAESM